MKDSNNPIQVVLYEGTGSKPFPSSDRFALTSSLLDQGYSVSRVSENTKTGDTSTSPTIIVLGQFSDSAPEVVDSAGTVKIETRDTTGLSPETILENEDVRKVYLGTEFRL